MSAITNIFAQIDVNFDKPAATPENRVALIDKVVETLGTEYRGLKQYRGV